MVDRDRAWAIEHVVVTEIRGLLETTGRAPNALAARDRLEDLGITSLDLADLVVALNVTLAANPFGQALAFTDVRTVADLCRAYQPPSNDHGSSTSPAELEETRQRARARRAAVQG